MKKGALFGVIVVTIGLFGSVAFLSNNETIAAENSTSISGDETKAQLGSVEGFCDNYGVTLLDDGYAITYTNDNQTSVEVHTEYSSDGEEISDEYIVSDEDLGTNDESKKEYSSDESGEVCETISYGTDTLSVTRRIWNMDNSGSCGGSSQHFSENITETKLLEDPDGLNWMVMYVDGDENVKAYALSFDESKVSLLEVEGTTKTEVETYISETKVDP